MVLCDMDFPNHGIIDSDVSTNTTIAAGKIHHQQSVTVELSAPTAPIVATSKYLCQIHGGGGNLISFDLTLRTASAGNANNYIDVTLYRGNFGTDFESMGTMRVTDQELRTTATMTLDLTQLDDGDVLYVGVTLTEEEISQLTIPQGVAVTLTWNEEPRSG